MHGSFLYGEGSASQLHAAIYLNLFTAIWIPSFLLLQPEDMPWVSFPSYEQLKCLPEYSSSECCTSSTINIGVELWVVVGAR
jgi:hypothetical protein